MKVIFLDVDGVLNTPKLIREFGMDHIDDILVLLVKRIVKETNAEIVLSSTWRAREKDKMLVQQALARHDLEIFDSTPLIEKERHEEIRAWLESYEILCEKYGTNNRIEKFAIIDDFDEAEIQGSFFKTDENRGITPEIVDQVIRHLK